MPRKARVTAKNGCYHVITRGNQKQFVFQEPSDYEKFLSLLEKYKKKYKFKLYAFCLMPNHVHLLIECGMADLLNKLMHGINLSYTLYFNCKYKKVGHLWQDRFKSRIIENYAYLLVCLEYIENNPLRASLVDNLASYPWSSLNFRKHRFAILDNLFSV